MDNPLRDINESARLLNVSQSAFLAAMSHEMRTPMNAILGMADLIAESPLNFEQRRYMEVLRRAGSGLLVLINDTLDLSKLEAGHLALEWVEFDLLEVVEQAIELAAVKGREKGNVLLSDLSPSLATSLMGDPNRLRQVLINLLGNAIKFTDSGQVLLAIRNDDESGESGQVEFVVSDTGIGIPGDKLETIFDDFIQADTTTTLKYGGTGLGLGISRRLVAAMGGTLTATSTTGVGSTFRFTAHLEPAPENGRTVRITPRELEGKRVLLIDANACSGRILRETFQVWGLETDVFQMPAEALADLPAVMVSGQPYSLVLINSYAVEMNHFEIACEIKRIDGSLPIVWLVSDTHGIDIRGMESLLSGYAVKPVNRTHLHRLVCEALQTQESSKPPRIDLNHMRTDATPPARILVVDDSADNRLLVEAYLKDAPYLLTFEKDGKAAVDRFSTSEFDLILMDVQMPVMDGLAATRAIRTIERAKGLLSIPILALTANVTLRDFGRSGSAGCNAHLCKPISKLELISAIEKYRRRLNPANIAHPCVRGPIQIEMPRGLEDIVPGYLANRRKEVPELLELLAASDFKRLAILGHNIKGTGGAYGFPELTNLGAALEQFAKLRNRPSLHTMVAELGNYLDQVQLISHSHNS